MTVTFNDVDGSDVVNVGAAFTNNLTVNLDTDTAANKVDATGYTGPDRRRGAGEFDTSAHTITGGSGTTIRSIHHGNAITKDDLLTFQKSKPSSLSLTPPSVWLSTTATPPH